MDSFSSLPPHIQPPTAQVPRAIRELLRVVPLMLMYSSMLSVSPCLFGNLVLLSSHATAGPRRCRRTCEWPPAKATLILVAVSRDPYPCGRPTAARSPPGVVVLRQGNHFPRLSPNCRSAVTIKSPRLVFLFLPNLSLVFALRTQASHDRHTLVIQEKNCARLWPVHSLDHILNCGKGRGAGRTGNTENLVLWFARQCARAVCRD